MASIKQTVTNVNILILKKWIEKITNNLYFKVC